MGYEQKTPDGAVRKGGKHKEGRNKAAGKENPFWAQRLNLRIKN
jgi:hypothetical protein